MMYASLGTPALAGEVNTYSLERSNTGWVEQVRRGETVYGASIDAKLVERDGKTFIEEEPHPFEIPSEYESEPVRTIRKDTWKDRVEGDDTTLEIYAHREDPRRRFVVWKMNDIPAMSCFVRFDSHGNSHEYGARGSYNADRNFEQDQSGGRTNFAWWLDDYFPEHRLND